MNCDQVFMVLTRGPFPTGGPEDGPVQHHLQGCPDCMQLAEALRPAHDIFQEAVSPAEARDLPGYWVPELATDSPAVGLPGVTMRQVASASQHPGGRSEMRTYAPASAVRYRPMVVGQSYAHRQPATPTNWSDVLHVLSFLAAVTAAGCGLCWLCS